MATAAVGMVLIAAVAGLTYAVKHSIASRVQAQAEREVQAVADRLAAGMSPEDAVRPTNDPDLVGGNVFTYVAILDAEGHPVVGSGFFAIAGVPDEGVSIENIGGEPTVSVGSSDLAIAQRSTEVDGELLFVVGASPLAEAVRGIDTIIRVSLLGGPLVILLVGVVTWTATGRTLQPIERIRTEVEDLSSQTLDRRVPVPHTDDEVARLAATMNRMLARIETASARQREFVADASHELRSPVASIRAELEVTLAHPAASSWRDVATGVLDETGRIERIVEDLLLLARLEEGAVVGDTATVDVGRLVSEATARIVNDAIDVDVDVDVAEGLFVKGRQDELASVVRNLVDNAARHAVSAVAVVAAIHDSTVVLTVDDDGPGIPPVDRERVFQRFTRLEHARSRSDGGVGLGLAVVKRVVHHHNGSVKVVDSPLGGARFKVVLSAAPAALSETAPERRPVA